MPKIQNKEAFLKALNGLSPSAQQDVQDHLVRHDFVSFVHKVFITLEPASTYLHNWHIEAAADYLRAVEKGEVTRLLAAFPPRTLKSIIFSVAFNAWMLGHKPHFKILNGSYNSKLAKDFGRKTREVMQSAWYKRIFPDTVLVQTTVDDLITSKGGRRMAFGVGSGVTGMGADMLIFDDLLRPDESKSDTIRNKTNDWLFSTFFSRLNDKKNGVIIGTMQRVHEEDCMGFLMEKGKWETLVLPAEFMRETTILTPSKAFTMEAGELLFAQRLDHDFLNEVKQANPYVYSGQYLQQPSPEGGGIFKSNRFRYYTHENMPRSFKCVIHSWDTAMLDQDINDFSACTVWGVHESGFYLLDMIKYKKLPDALKLDIIRLNERDKPKYVLIEFASAGAVIGIDLQNNSHVPVIRVPVADKVNNYRLSKIDRASLATNIVDQGKVYLPTPEVLSPAQQIAFKEYMSELTIFPNAKHDDYVDSTSMFLRWASKNIDNLLSTVLDYEEVAPRGLHRRNKYTGF